MNLLLRIRQIPASGPREHLPTAPGREVARMGPFAVLMVLAEATLIDVTIKAAGTSA